MLARVISFQVPPQRVEEVENAYRTSLLPETETYEGFVTMLTLRNEETDEMLELTLWRDEEARVCLMNGTAPASLLAEWSQRPEGTERCRGEAS